MKIAFFTDIHISEDTKPIHGVDTLKNTQNVIKAVQQWSPDHLVIGGDISYKAPIKSTNELFKTEIGRIGIEYDIICGNHDESADIIDLFYRNFKSNSELYYSRIIEGQFCIFLDTSKAILSDDQWSWFETKLNEVVDSRVLIFMHHPPSKVGIGFMDGRLSFKESKRFQALVSNYTFDKLVFTGHYHIELSVIKTDFQLYITPSCFIQSNPSKDVFEIFHSVPAIRKIVIEDDYVKTWVEYLF